MGRPYTNLFLQVTNDHHGIVHTYPLKAGPIRNEIIP
jgi:hypothetical protein